MALIKTDNGRHYYDADRNYYVPTEWGDLAGRQFATSDEATKAFNEANDAWLSRMGEQGWNADKSWLQARPAYDSKTGRIQFYEQAEDGISRSNRMLEFERPANLDTAQQTVEATATTPEEQVRQDSVSGYEPSGMYKGDIEENQAEGLVPLGNMNQLSTFSVSERKYSPQEIHEAKQADREQRRIEKAASKVYRKSRDFDAFKTGMNGYLSNEREAREMYERLQAVEEQKAADRQVSRERYDRVVSANHRRGTAHDVRTPEITRRYKKRYKERFSESGVGRRVYDKLLPNRSLAHDEVGIGYESFAEAIRQDPAYVKQIMIHYHLLGQDEVLEEMSIMEVVRRINESNVKVATFKPPNNQGPDSQLRVLRILTDVDRGVYIHPSQAKLYNADFDGDDMEVSLDLNARSMVKDPWSYYIHNGDLMLDLDFMHIAKFQGIAVGENQMGTLDYIKSVVLEGLPLGSDEKLTKDELDQARKEGLSREEAEKRKRGQLQAVAVAVRDLGDSAELTDAEKEQARKDGISLDDALAKKKEAALKEFITTLNKLLGNNHWLCTRVFERVYKHMHTIHTQNMFLDRDVSEVIDKSDMPEPVTVSDRALYSIMDGMVLGIVPNNFQEFKVFMNAFIGNVEGKNAPFRFTGAIGKMIRFDKRITVGGDLVIENGDDKTLEEFFKNTVKYVESLHISQQLREKGRNTYYMTELRKIVIDEVGLPPKPGEGDYKDWLMTFVKSYNRHAAIINEANVIHRSNMGISKASNREAVNMISSKRNLSKWEISDMVKHPLRYVSVGDVAQALMDVYGRDFELKTMLPHIVWMDNPNINGNDTVFGDDDIWFNSAGQGRFETGWLFRNDKKESRDSGSGRRYVLRKYENYTMKYFSMHNSLVTNKKEQELLNNVAIEAYDEATDSWTLDPAIRGEFKSWPDRKNIFSKIRNLWFYKYSKTGKTTDRIVDPEAVFDENTELEWLILMAVADKKESITSAYNNEVYGRSATGRNENGVMVTARKTRMQSGKRTMLGMTLDMLDQMNMMLANEMDSEDVGVMFDEILQVMQYFDTDMLMEFGMDTTEGFLRSDYGQRMLAIARHDNEAESWAYNPDETVKEVRHNKKLNIADAEWDTRAEELAGLRYEMEFEYKMRNIRRIDGQLANDGDLKNGERMELEAQLENEIAALRQNSVIWTCIIDEWLENESLSAEARSGKAVPQTRTQQFLSLAAQKQASHGLLDKHGSEHTAMAMKLSEENQDLVRAELYAGRLWLDDRTWTIEEIFHSGLGGEQVMNLVTDIARYRSKNVHIQSYDTSYQLECDDADVFSLYSHDDESKFDPYKDYASAYEKYTDMSWFALKAEVDAAKKEYRRASGGKHYLLDTCRYLADNPWYLVQVDDGIVADAICAPMDKDYAQTEKAKQHPWINILYTAVSYQRNGGFYDDIYRTDDRVLGLQHADNVSMLDIVKLFSDRNYHITVYDDYGDSVRLDMYSILNSSRSGPLGSDGEPKILDESSSDDDIEIALWNFIESHPRIASYMRAHKACASTSPDGSGFIGSSATLKDTIDHVNHVENKNQWMDAAKYTLRDHPGYYGLISMLSPKKDAVSRKSREQIMETEEYVCACLVNAMVNAPGELGEAKNYGQAVVNMLDNMGISVPKLAKLLESDYVRYCNESNGTTDIVDHEALQEAEAIYTDLVKFCTIYVKELRDRLGDGFDVAIPLNRYRREHIDMDIASVASYWDMVQEISGAKTAISTGVEGSETYNYAAWASRFPNDDVYADLETVSQHVLGDAKLAQRFAEYDKDAATAGGYKTNVLDSNGNPMTYIVEIDEKGRVTDNYEDLLELNGQKDVVVEVPGFYQILDLSSDNRRLQQMSSLGMYMVSKRSNGAEKYNLKVRKSGRDDTDSMTKMNGKYIEQRDFDSVYDQLDDIYTRTGDYSQVVNELANILYEANTDLGYDDLRLANYYNIAAKMVIVGDDGYLVLRSLEQLCHACKRMIGPDAEDIDIDNAIKDIVNTTSVEGDRIAIGAGVLDYYEGLVGVKPKRKSSSVSGVRGVSSGFDLRRAVLEQISEEQKDTGFLTYSDAKMVDEQMRRVNLLSEDDERGEGEAKTVGDLLKNVLYLGEYNVIGVIGNGSNEITMRTDATEKYLGTEDELEVLYTADAFREYGEEASSDLVSSYVDKRFRLHDAGIDINEPLKDENGKRETWKSGEHKGEYKTLRNTVIEKKGFDKWFDDRVKNGNGNKHFDIATKRGYDDLSLGFLNGSDPSESIPNEGIGESNLWIIGPGATEEQVARYCDRAYELGITVLVYGGSERNPTINMVPDKYRGDALDVMKTNRKTGEPYVDNAYMIPMFDMRMNGYRDVSSPRPRFEIEQVSFDNYTIMAEDKNNIYGLGEAEYKATKHLVDRVHVNDGVIGKDDQPERIRTRDMFENLFAERDLRAARGEPVGKVEFSLFSPEWAASNGLQWRNFAIDYGVAEGAPGFERRKMDVMRALSQYDNFDENGIVRGQTLYPGSVVGFVMATETLPDGTERYVLAPIIPFQLHERKKNVPSEFSVSEVWFEDDDHSKLSLKWVNTAPIDKQYAKYFDSSGSANKGMVNFADAEMGTMTLKNGMQVDLYSAAASFAGRNIGTDSRIKTMASLMAVARMTGYNFANLESSFPETEESLDQGRHNWKGWPRKSLRADSTEQKGIIKGPADLKDRLQRGERIGSGAWEQILGIPGFRFSTDRRIDMFLKHECRKILDNGGNPTDYLMCSFYRTDENGNEQEYNTHVMWEFEAMFSRGIKYEDDLLHFMHAMNPSLCPDGLPATVGLGELSESPTTLFRVVSGTGYNNGVLQMQVPYADGDQVAYIWSNVYVGISFFGEDYSGFSRPNIDGSSNFLDAMMTAGYYGRQPRNKNQIKASVGWASAEYGRHAWTGWRFYKE